MSFDPASRAGFVFVILMGDGDSSYLHDNEGMLKKESEYHT
jgi:hypothetical protein